MESILQIDSLDKSFGDQIIFRGFTLNIARGEKVGIIARNGAGKSTLLNIISGQEDYSAGSIIFRRDTKVSYLEQSPAFPVGSTILQACTGHLGKDDWESELAAKQMLSQLGINDTHAPTDHLSGGQTKRIALARALLSKPEFLIMDEPTNHLDVEVTEWLEDYLSASNLTLLLVTHDRYLLDRVCTRIVEIDDYKAYSYEGNYSYYLEKRQERICAEQSQRESDLNLYRTELDWMRRMPCARGTKAKYRKDAFHDLEERLQKRRVEQSVKLDVKASYIGNKIFEISHLSKSFPNRVILKDFSYLFSRYEKLGIIGPNGVGKTTFLKLLLGQLQPDSGTIERGSTLKIGYYSQEGIQFDPDARVIDIVTDIADNIKQNDGRSVSAGQFLQNFLFSPAAQRKYVRKLSGGEKRRLYLCTILIHNPNFLILDEPTNDLDVTTLQVLEEYLAGYGGCVIVVSHDRYFMDKVADHLFILKGDGSVVDFPSSYSDYIMWQEMKRQEAKAEQEMRQSNKQPSAQQPPAIKGDYSKKLSFKEKREMEQIEAELESLEKEQREAEELLNSGTLPYDRIQQLSQRIGEIIERTDTITMRWMELSEKCS